MLLRYGVRRYFASIDGRKQIACRVSAVAELYLCLWPSYSEVVRRSLALVLLFSLFAATSCSRVKRYPLKGQVIAVDTTRQELTVTHEDIQGFMPGMTMPFKVREAADVAAAKPGDLITATLAVEDSTGYLEDVVKIGEAPLPAASTPAASRTIEPGTQVPDAEVTDQQGQKRRISDWRGKTLGVTFVYTRCPLPDFCPLMDRHFAAVQRVLDGDAALRDRVHLMSVSFDPDYDTPEVLRAHAKRVGAKPETWSYVTGTRESVDPFAAAFGVSIIRDDKPLQEIVHNLRTAVIDREGRLVTIFRGNDWKPEQLVDALRTADARR